MFKVRFPAFVGGAVVLTFILVVSILTQVAGASPTAIYLPVVFNNASTCTRVPTLVSPANGGTLTTVTPLFQWNWVDDPSITSIYVQIDTSPSFSTNAYLYTPPPAAGSIIGEIRYPGDLNNSTTYYWRVYFACGNTQGPYSATWSFTTPSSVGTHLPAPTLIAPANGATISPNQVTFQWSSVAGALDYLVLWCPGTCNTFSFAYTTNTQYTASGLLPSTQYQWWARARSAYGDGYGNIWTFTTTAATAAASSPSAPRVGGSGAAILPDRLLRPAIRR